MAQPFSNPEGKQPAPPETGRDRFVAAVNERRAAVDDPETEIWQGGYSAWAMLGAWIFCGLLTIAAIVLGVLFAPAAPLAWPIIGGVVLLLWVIPLLRLAYMRLAIAYRLTTQRFFHEEGILRRTTDRIEVIDMDDITYTQGIIQRMLGIGSIHITSSDKSHPELHLHGIADVKNVASQIDQARRSERIRRGLHIASV